jgi:hypothetical protein
MHNVFMTSGIFRPIFGYCTCDAAGVEELYFDKLFETEEHGSVFFVGHRFSQYPPVSPRPSSNTLQRKGAQVKQRISYYSGHGHVI